MVVRWMCGGEVVCSCVWCSGEVCVVVRWVCGGV